MSGNTALNPGFGGDLISDEDVTGVAQLSTTTSGTGTVSGTSFSLAVASTSGFSSSGYVWLWSSGANSWVLVNYSGTSGGNTFTGCTVDKITLASGSSFAAPTWSSGAVVAQALLKLPRSKVVLGDVGVDGGDVSALNPMPVYQEGAASTDVLGVNVSGSRNNQIEISFFSAPGASLITDTTTSTGSITQSSGHTLYSTGTGTTAYAKGVSVGSTTYRPAHELYAYFTAGFTTPTSSNSYQRIGIYDTVNGFSVGYSGTTFGVWKRTNSSDTFTARSSWNGDPLDGSSTSKFTRAGAPEAINLTYSNLFRIRFAWLGSASILFEVFSPDGTWVTFHTIRQPNSELNPSVTTPNLPMTIDVSKTSADATALVVATACWAAGTTSSYVGVSETITDQTLAMLSRSVIVGKSSSGGGTYNNVKVTPSGSLTVALGDITGIVGQATMANSVPVTIASDQSAVAVSAASLPLPSGAATSSNQTTLGSQTTKINDGTNTATVKAASTAAVSADPALVVALSPNSPIKADIEPAYGTSNQAVTITLTSLASSATAARASTFIDNTTDLFEDALFFIKYQTIASATATGYLNVYGYASVDGGTTYSGGATGADAALTLTTPTPLVLLVSLPANASSTQYNAGPFSFCRLYGIDRLPERWGFVVRNASGQALSATAANNKIFWQGVRGKFA